MKVSVHHTLRDFADDQKDVAKRADRDMKACVREGARAGNEIAKDYAREKNPPGSHSYKYPGTFAAGAVRGFHGFGGAAYSAEYGPLARGQGILAPILENGDRSENAPQMNLARSADRIGPSFAQEARRLPDKWFWT
ncbi:hypothetical protein J2X46_002700 [Nocardioides sp. BE266]|uniref:hypothetical protein n=1 Tax=Nocardioides sp. BE266 TaxID=2817725 RepID=UPI00285F9062|nr:hypothetical protein [Nocardioides sp. BE266]MDR7253710.1 hypothetical protein [Nocardioides sp. BE266]